MRRISVCLVSGGLDSCIAAAAVKKDGDALYFLTVNYGQVMQRELDAARVISRRLQPIDHRFIDVPDFRHISRSSRTDRERIEPGVYPPKPSSRIPAAYPPGRDFSFIFMAAAWAESLLLDCPEQADVARIVIGTNKDDAIVYPDCRSQVYEILSQLMASSTKAAVELGKTLVIWTPLITLSKTEVLRLGLKLGAPVEESWSCYQGGEKACGRCDPCLARLYAFAALGKKDRWAYQTEKHPVFS